MEGEKFWDKLNEISERLARVETMIQADRRYQEGIMNTLKSHEDRLSELESHKYSSIGAREVVAFLVMAGLALWGVLK